MTRAVLASAARRVGVAIRERGGAVIAIPDPRRFPDPPVIEVVDLEALLLRVAEQPKIGIGEGYMAGQWRPAEGTDLAAVLVPFARRLPTAVPAPLRMLRRLVDQRIPHSQRNTVTGSRSNISAHYDLSNDLFAAFLDPTLSYSSALFADESVAGPITAQSLREAQLRKATAVLDLAGVRAGQHVLEIGTGWGTLAIEAARRGARVTTITLSAEQAHLARQRIAQAGLASAVEVRLQDYRQVTGQFDAIVSVEMIEAVGQEFWPTYFNTLDRLLAPGGQVAIQSILMSHDRYLATRNSFGWIQKHIFPGGLIPSAEAIEATATRYTDLQVTATHRFGRDYAETLRRWRARFDKSWPQIAELGFDRTFRRMWDFYLAYCEAGFATGYLDVAQIQMRRVEPAASRPPVAVVSAPASQAASATASAVGREHRRVGSALGRAA